MTNDKCNFEQLKEWKQFLIFESCLEMDFEYLRIVLNDFTMKQLFVINWLNNKLNDSIGNRSTKILHLLNEYCPNDLKGWTALKVDQALMAISELGFLNRDEEKKLNDNLYAYLNSEKCSNNILRPCIETCCGSRLKMSPGRNITVFNNNQSYIAMLPIGDCERCRRKYSHNYFLENKQKFITNESIFDKQVMYFGGGYGYEKSFIKWLSNSILYLHSGFENFAKCYNETKKLACTSLQSGEESLSPTRLQDFWFLYNYIVFSFFYTDVKILRIPDSW